MAKPIEGWTSHRQEFERRPAERVVVTGLDLLSPLGGATETWEGLLTGRSGAIFKNVGNFRTNISAPVAFNPEDYDFFDKKDRRDLPRLTMMSIVVAKNALTQAGLLSDNGKVIEELSRNRIGVTLSSGIGLAINIMTVDRSLRESSSGESSHNPSRRIRPSAGMQTFPEQLNAQVAIHLGLSGWPINSAEACSTSLASVVEAARLVKEGYADVVVAGGGEEILDEHGDVGTAIFSSVRALSKRNENPKTASRPFDVDRDGFVMASGSGVVIVEREDLALKRGAKILAEITGFEKSIDGLYDTEMDRDNVAKTITRALYNPTTGDFNDTDAIFAHATSTPIGDENEIEALRLVFGEELSHIPITAIKSVLGHMMGGAGVATLISAIYAMSEGVIPPILNLEKVDEPFQDLALVRGEPLRVPVNSVLALAFGFGGHNSVVRLQKYQQES